MILYIYRAVVLCNRRCLSYRAPHTFLMAPRRHGKLCALSLLPLLCSLSLSLSHRWKGDKYYIGRLSRKVRHLRIVNTLTHDEHTVDVCAEEKLANVRARYLDFNAHAKSYSWKRLGEELDMEKTLAENGIIDESEDFYELNLDEDFYIPAVHIYFNDDLTVA
eukprot:TRINITY_DN9961_c0_g1_i2.p1 TRINITY_DN9961_c0_g1~~TRINITY_DN9961_c0_g1_i2.p1  ORF type:complete len:163 (+),score=24.53 TRINITY_DN9961_c0_g1_i2:485-973(+)